MTIFSWASNLKSKYLYDIKVTQTDTGSHGINWHAIFDQTEDAQQLMGRLVQAIEVGKKLTVSDSITVMTDSVIRGIIHNEAVITGFPYLKGFIYEQFKPTSIAEWSHADNLEAVVEVSHLSGCSLGFFATDYAINKSIYKTQKDLSINVVGLIYDLSEFNAHEWNQRADKQLTFSQDFCGYFPISEDEIQFIGRIQNTQEHSLGEIGGYLITVGITPGINVEFFIAKKNLFIELVKGKAVHGIAWMQGTLEK
jgi:hypothetical protein